MQSSLRARGEKWNARLCIWNSVWKHRNYCNLKRKRKKINWISYTCKIRYNFINVYFILAVGVHAASFLKTNWSDFEQRSLHLFFFILLLIGRNCQKPIICNHQSETITVSCLQIVFFYFFRFLDKVRCRTWWPGSIRCPHPANKRTIIVNQQRVLFLAY